MRLKKHRLIEVRSQKKRIVYVEFKRHVQRGGMPSAWDRIIAAGFGKAVIDLIAQEQFDRMVAWCNEDVWSFQIENISRLILLFIIRPLAKVKT